MSPIHGKSVASGFTNITQYIPFPNIAADEWLDKKTLQLKNKLSG
jgi:hypothetical protein